MEAYVSMSLPKVSIYMTVKNGLPWIRDTIESILNQTLTEWELIIVDDGSSDGTTDLLRYYASCDSRINLIITEGVGRGKALNMALNRCSAEYVANIDADDVSHPKRLEFELEAIKNNPDYSLVCTKSIFISSETTIQWPVMETKREVIDITRKLIYRNPINHSSIIAKKENLLAVGGYDEYRSCQYDYDLWVRLAISNFRIGYLDLPLVAKRLHKKQSFETKERLYYLIESSKVQARAIKKLGGSKKAWVILLFRFGWGLLPRDIRKRFFDVLKVFA